MEITILSEEENPMLHRTDVRFRVSHVEATPDRLAVRDSLAARLNKSADEVVIRKLGTKFGMRTTLGEAKVYEGPEFTTEVEQTYMLARNKIGDAAEPVEEPEEAPDEPEEAPEEPAEEAAEEAEEVEPEAEEESEEEAVEETEEEAAEEAEPEREDEPEEEAAEEADEEVEAETEDDESEAEEAEADDEETEDEE